MQTYTGNRHTRSDTHKCIHTHSVTQTQERSHGHTDPSQVGLSDLPRTGSRCSPEPKRKPALEGWTFALFPNSHLFRWCQLSWRKGGKGSAQRVTSVALWPEEEDLPCTALPRPLAFLQPRPSPRSENPRGEGTCVLRSPPAFSTTLKCLGPWNSLRPVLLPQIILLRGRVRTRI